uniref:Uncharacterized protein n=1 Tax=Anguilla anguilla TaxID=7936 RepID=A0A0E9WKH6_ANGAN
MSVSWSPGPQNAEPGRTSCTIPVGSHWTPTLHTETSVCLRGTER